MVYYELTQAEQAELDRARAELAAHHMAAADQGILSAPSIVPALRSYAADDPGQHAANENPNQSDINGGNTPPNNQP